MNVQENFLIPAASEGCKDRLHGWKTASVTSISTDALLGRISQTCVLGETKKGQEHTMKVSPFGTDTALQYLGEIYL